MRKSTNIAIKLLIKTVNSNKSYKHIYSWQSFLLLGLCLWYKVCKTSTLIYPYKSPTYHYRNISYVQFAVFVTDSFVHNIEHHVGTRDGKKEAQKIDIV